MLAAALVLTAVAASAAASAALSEPPDPAPAQQLRGEIDDMIASGVPGDDPKVEMLEDAVEELTEADPTPPRDPGAAGIADRIADAEAAEGSGTASRTAPADGARPSTAPPAWQSGPVLCEVVPGQLGPDEITGAVCASVPLPDGTARYVAVTPDGTVRSVLFAADGRVQRLDDVRASAAVPPRSAVASTPDGRLTITPPGRPAMTVDLP